MDDKQTTLVRAMDDREVRLNCLLAAVNSYSSWGRSRMTDPITIAEEFHQWVTLGIAPTPSRVQFGGVPAVVEHGYASGEAAPTAEAERAAAGQGDLIEIQGARTRPRS